MQTEIEKEDLICDAIQNRRQLAFQYQGHSRTVNPHLIGVYGNAVHLHAYQISNGTNSNIPNWKNFAVAEMENIKQLDSTFELEPTYNPSNAGYSNIILMLEK